MKKSLILGLLVTMVLFVFSGCSTSSLKDQSTLFINDMFSEKYEVAIEQMDEELKTTMNQEALAEIVISLQKQFGDFDSVISATVKKDSTYPDHSIATVYGQFGENKIKFELAYNKEEKLSGFNVFAPEAPVISEEAQNTIKENSRVFVESIFTGDPKTAYELLNPAGKAMYTEEGLLALKDDIEQELGSYDSLGKATINETQVVLFVSFAEGNKEFTIDADSDGMISRYTVKTVVE